MYFLFSSSFCCCTLHQNSVGSQPEMQAGVAPNVAQLTAANATELTSPCKEHLCLGLLPAQRLF